VVCSGVFIITYQEEPVVVVPWGAVAVVGQRYAGPDLSVAHRYLVVTVLAMVMVEVVMGGAARWPIRPRIE
jgi:hypothetical protein